MCGFESLDGNSVCETKETEVSAKNTAVVSMLSLWTARGSLFYLVPFYSVGLNSWEVSGGKFLWVLTWWCQPADRSRQSWSSLFRDSAAEWVTAGNGVQNFLHFDWIAEKICRNDITAMHIKIQPPRLSVALATDRGVYSSRSLNWFPHGQFIPE